MGLSASLEDYLEAIFEIDKTKRAVRVKDVAHKLGVTMPSVNGALKNLEGKGLIAHEKYDYIELTEDGFFQASKIASRHKLIFNFLKDVLEVDIETAQEDACKIEHVLSSHTIEKLTGYMDRFKDNEKNNGQS
ncbi:MAG: metal-dependent transcriptional regulator [Candidatus Latescibacteria bacterium]|nr:metal-dependent transcriptional regulator [Candidatus Latescibacterota bacterium]